MEELSKHNRRDLGVNKMDFRCQFCGEEFCLADLNLDQELHQCPACERYLTKDQEEEIEAYKEECDRNQAEIDGELGELKAEVDGVILGGLEKISERVRGAVAIKNKKIGMIGDVPELIKTIDPLIKQKITKDPIYYL